MQEYSFATQAQIVSAFVILHNIIISYNPDEISSDEVKTESYEDDLWNDHQVAISCKEQTRAVEHRNQITLAMWEDYSARPLCRHV